MDLSLSFSSPQRRTSKLELSFPDFKSKAYDNNVLPIHLPIESDSSNSVFETPSGCRITRWVLPNYSTNCSYVQKSFQCNKSNSSTQKVMTPKISSIALSFSQQTIVGGFVGSKSHAGRSFFGESSQIWDAVVCKFVQLMSLTKEKTSDNLSEFTFSNVRSSKMCDPNFSPLNKERPNERVFDSVADTKFSDSNSVKINPELSGISNLNLGVDKISKNSPKSVPLEVCDSFENVKKEQTMENCSEILPLTPRKTYSSVVNRTCKNNTQCARPESYVVIKPQFCEQPLENCKASLPSPPKQSYADVAKTIPYKSLGSQKKLGCEMIQNFKKRILNCKSSRGKREFLSSPTKRKPVNTSKNPSMNDIMTSGDTRWRADSKSKRTKFQKSHPVTLPASGDVSTNDETIGKDVIEEGCTEDSTTGSESGRHAVCAEAVRTECGMRGRYPSECSLDSDDSFVVFEDYPDAAMSSSPNSSVEQNSSLEVDEEFADDESISSNDDSDSEDASLDNGDGLNFSPVASSKLQKANCEWGRGCSTYAVPERGFKALRKKKVHFAEGCRLAVIRPMVAWGYAYRESRRGPWEIHARDRARFHCRIDSLAPLLNSVLDPQHRKRILESRFSDS